MCEARSENTWKQYFTQLEILLEAAAMEQAQEGQRGQEHRLDRRLEGCRKGSVSQVSGIF